MQAIRGKRLWQALSVAALVSLTVTSAPAHADSIDIFSDTANSTEGLGQFTGSIDYSFAGPLGTLVVTLTNTSPAANGGYISGFLFNIEGNNASALFQAAESSASAASFQPASGSGVPFGPSYESGAALGGEFLGGGSPVGGIAVGSTGVFVFDVTGADVPLLTASSFIGDPGDFGFIVRFKGFNDDGSDKVPAAIIPLPAPVALGAAGLLAVMVGSRLTRRRLGVAA